MHVVAAVQSELPVRSVLVGGAAVRIYDETYGPTDIDLIAITNLEQQRETMVRLGFRHGGGRHWEYEFSDQEIVAVEFVGNAVFPGEFSPEPIELAQDETVLVIDPHGLLVDRLLQRMSGDVPESELRNLVAGLGNLIDWDLLLNLCRDYESRGIEHRGLVDLAEMAASWVTESQETINSEG